MAVKNNPISYYEGQGWTITSNPREYYQSYNPPRGKKKWGQRDLMEYGINTDAYCNGKHPAYDLGREVGAPIKSFTDGTVLNGTGWNTFGNTLVIGFSDAKGNKYQVIFGHLRDNPLNTFNVGDNVKKGQVIAHQGNTNNLGVNMAHHLHIQFQPYKAYDEWNFTCVGIDPLNIDIGKTKPTNGKAPTKKAKKKKAVKNTKDKYQVRPNRQRAWFRGVIASTNGMGAGVRRYSGGTFSNPFQDDLPDGTEVYIFRVRPDGWARVYSVNNKGWVHLDQVKVLEYFN